jgi:hypothetical protein
VARMLYHCAVGVLAEPACSEQLCSPTLNRYDSLCDDGTRAVSTWSPTLQQWTTTVTPPPGQTCTGRLNPKTRQWEGRCR